MTTSSVKKAQKKGATRRATAARQRQSPVADAQAAEPNNANPLSLDVERDDELRDIESVEGAVDDWADVDHVDDVVDEPAITRRRR